MKVYLVSGLVAYFSGILYCAAQIMANGSVTGIERWYDQKVGIDNTGILNGEQYLLPVNTASTHPFFDNSSGASGNVIFHRQFYDDITLLFDIFSDNVILKHRQPSGNYSFVVLDKRKVDAFQLGDRKFLKMTSSARQIVSGFYQLLYEGKNIMLVARRKKTTKVNPDGRLDFEETDEFFLIRDLVWTRVKNARGFRDISTSKDGNNQLRTFLRSNHIRFREHLEDDLVQTTRWYDTMRQGK